MEISNNDIKEAINFFRGLDNRYDQNPNDETLAARYGAGRVLTLLRIDLEEEDEEDNKIN